MSLHMAHRAVSLLHSSLVAFGGKQTSTSMRRAV